MPTSQLFRSQQHRELIAQLQHIIRSRACRLITDEVGAGESTAVWDACTRDQRVVDEASVRRVASEFDETERAAAGW